MSERNHRAARLQFSPQRNWHSPRLAFKQSDMFSYMEESSFVPSGSSPKNVPHIRCIQFCCQISITFQLHLHSHCRSSAEFGDKTRIRSHGNCDQSRIHRHLLQYRLFVRGHGRLHMTMRTPAPLNTLIAEFSGLGDDRLYGPTRACQCAKVMGFIAGPSPGELSHRVGPRRHTMKSNASGR